MSKLRLGKMSGQEIAEWLGILYSTYKRSPKKYLQRLEDYCEYEQVRGGAIIKTIYVEEYDKNLRTNNDKLYLQELKRCDNLASVSGMAKRYEKSPYMLRKTRDRLFGEEPTNIDTSSHAKGIIGSREFVWAIKLEGEDNYRYLTKEEDELFNSLISQVYGAADPELIRQKELILKTCVKKGMSAAEYERIITVQGCNFFTQVIDKFKTLTGRMIVHATRHELGLNFEITDQEKQYADSLFDYYKNMDLNDEELETIEEDS